MTPIEPRSTARDLRLAYLASLLVALGIGLASGAGLVSDAHGLYGDSSLVLISRGADVANLVLIVPILLGAMWLARRGSLFGLLLWPGALFYALDAYVPYMVGAPFNALFFVYAGLVTLSAFTVIGSVASIDGQLIRQRLAGAPARGIGVALAVIAVAACAGLAGTAITALGDPAGEAATRPLAVTDWALGTPALLAGGLLHPRQRERAEQSMAEARPLRVDPAADWPRARGSLSQGRCQWSSVVADAAISGGERQASAGYAVPGACARTFSLTTSRLSSRTRCPMISIMENATDGSSVIRRMKLRLSSVSTRERPFERMVTDRTPPREMAISPRISWRPADHKTTSVAPLAATTSTVPS